MREKLVEMIRMACDNGKDCAATVCWECLADGLIAQGFTFATDNNVGRWIPVSERLPEDDLPKDSTSKQIKVLVAYKRRNCSWVIRTQLRQKGRWYGRPDEWDWSVSDPITHWMPLPEPPQEK